MSGEKKVTVLLVDDEPSVLNIVSRILTKDGFNVLPAPSGEKAVEVMQAHAAEVDVAVVDMWMPGMDGAATVAELRTIKPGLPVLVASGMCDEETTGRFPAGSVAAFVQKPYDRMAIREMIHTAVGA